MGGGGRGPGGGVWGRSGNYCLLPSGKRGPPFLLFFSRISSQKGEKVNQEVFLSYSKDGWQRCCCYCYTSNGLRKKEKVRGKEKEEGEDGSNNKNRRSPLLLLLRPFPLATNSRAQHLTPLIGQGSIVGDTTPYQFVSLSLQRLGPWI